MNGLYHCANEGVKFNPGFTAGSGVLTGGDGIRANMDCSMARHIFPNRPFATCARVG
jgi:hypothetical protein